MHGERRLAPPSGGITILDSTTTGFSHVKPDDTVWRSDGPRDFFLYKDLGVEAATSGRVLAQLVKANMAPEKGTGWHRHEADFKTVDIPTPCEVPVPTAWK